MPKDNLELLTGLQLHRRVVQEMLLGAKKFVWIATANLKDMHISEARRYKPILQVFDRMADQAVTFRIVHSDLPSRPFRETLERFPRLTKKALEMQICPRSHWKMVIVDGKQAYWGSANFTGAGLGAKGEHRRNHELGMLTSDPEWVERLQSLFDEFWIGSYCVKCAIRDKCPDPIGAD